MILMEQPERAGLLQNVGVAKTPSPKNIRGNAAEGSGVWGENAEWKITETRIEIYVLLH